MGFSLRDILTKEEIEFLNSLFPRKEEGKKTEKQKNKKKGGKK